MRSIAMPEQIDITDRPLVLSYSGGKDSGATWLAMRDAGIPIHTVLCADTGWEALEWYDHVRRFQDFMDVEIVTVRAEIDVPDHLMGYVEEIETMLGISPSAMVRQIVRKAMFPNRMQKWCTEDLKHHPCDEWVDDTFDRPDRVVHITGVRADESRKRAGYAVDEMHTKSGQWHWRPILHWTVQDVIEIHQRHRAPLCPLYDLGVSRVGCWPCMPASNKSEVRVLDDRRIAAIRRLEEIVNHLSLDRREARGLGTTGALYMSISDYPGIPPIDIAVAHAKTHRGTHRDQCQLFAPVALDTCQRWGVCDAGDDGFSC